MIDYENFIYYTYTEILFDCGRIEEIGTVASRFGSRVMIVTESMQGPLAPLFIRVRDFFKKGGLEIAQFDGVIPNL